MKQPILTIGMPVFNDIDFIEKSIISVLALEDIPFTLIISDDGATDGSDEICKKYAAIDPRISYVRQGKNLGISKNMEFLLKEAKTKYFMWAADDDLWDPKFARELVSILENNPFTVSAFCAFYLIDEGDSKISKKEIFDYQHHNTFKRLKTFVINPNDSFGYGIFRTENIRQVKFPIWWWPNKKTPYNNIFPTLAYYLSLGDYRSYNHEALFFKRIKTNAKTNHLTVGRGDGLKEFLAYTIRRFNLVCVTLTNIRKGSNILVTIRIFPYLFMHWFVKSVWIELGKALRNKFKKNNDKITM